MRRRFMKNMVAVIAVSVAVSMCSVTALAKIADPNTMDLSENPKGQTLKENSDSGRITTNNGTVETNNGTIFDNHGEVTTNNGYVDENKTTDESHDKDGSIGTNNGTVGTNNGDIGTNERTNEDSHLGKVNENNGDIDTNKGWVETNTETGTIDKNVEQGEVGENYGTINENSAKAESEDQSDANGGGIHYNYGTIGTNSGFVEVNDIKEADVSDSEYHDHVGTIKENTGTVKNNNAVIEDNSGHVEYNSSYEKVEETTNGGYTVDENAIIINKAGGTVYMNWGIVENNTGATVTYNNGDVYNYGGKVTGKKKSDENSTEYGVGTEYFSVSVTTTNGSTSYGDGFKDYKDSKWLGQSLIDNTMNTSKSTVTVTPSSGYQIENFNIPKDYENYITATKNSDGSWTLNVTSGYNIKLTPTATLIGGSISGTTDPVSTDKETPSGDTSGNKDTPKTITVDISLSSDSDSGNDNGSSGGMMNGLSNPQPTVTDGFSQNNMMTPLTINSVDFMGQGLSASVADVLKPIDNITAMNNFTAMGTQLPSTENMMVCGVVDFKNAFVNAATGSVDVPVEASVIAGNYYTVALSDGTTIQVKCETNGVLNIPFAASAQNLTFIIYGMQVNPAMLLAGETDQFQDALAGLTP